MDLGAPLGLFENASRLMPEFILTGTAILVLVVDAFSRKKQILLPYILGLAGLGAAIIAAWGLPNYVHGSDPLPLAFGAYVTFDNPSRYAKLLIFLTTGLTLLMSYKHRLLSQRPQGEYVSLLLMACLAMSFAVSASNFLLIYLVIEMLGITSYILVSYRRQDLRSSEAAAKYFLVGAFSSAIMLYGMTIIYGLYGTLNLYGISGSQVMTESQSTALLVALILVLVGLGFKIAMAPFHAWVPDVYEGAPTPITAFISVAPKIAGFLVIFRIFMVCFPLQETTIGTLIVYLSAVTMTIGNFAALQQRNIKRMLGYSTIAHVGYMLMGLSTGTELGFQGVLVYLAAYAIMNMGAFAVIVQVSNHYGGDRVEDFAGLAKTSLPTALAMAFFLLSLAGIPPTVGFLGKFFVFSAVLQSGFYVLAVIGILNSVVSLYYYFRIVSQMFFTDGGQNRAVTAGPALAITVAGTLAATILLGTLFPQLLFVSSENAAHLFGAL